MLPAAPARLDEADRCPGVLRLIEAQDGWVARVRLPGGLVSGAALAGLSQAAVDLGDGRLELTSRGNVQLRGLAPDASGALADRLAAVGLAPSATHERVRNIVASPLAGIDGGRDLTALIRALDAALCRDPRLAHLPGRFLFAFDDGRGDVAPGADVLAVVRDDNVQVEGMTASFGAAPGLMLRFAHAFLDERDEQVSAAWHVHELADGRARIRTRLGAPAAAAAAAPIAPRPFGRVAGALVVAPPLGRLTARHAEWLATHSAEPRITPWRSIVLPVAPDADPAGVGLVADGDSPWLSVSACAGRPRCLQALADVQADAAAAPDRFAGRRVHWSGCARRCGRPADVEVDVVATVEGYAINEL